MLGKEIRNKWFKYKAVGLMLMTVGHLSFTNRELFGDIVFLIGCIMVFGGSYMSWRTNKKNQKVV